MAEPDVDPSRFASVAALARTIALAWDAGRSCRSVQIENTPEAIDITFEEIESELEDAPVDEIVVNRGPRLCSDRAAPKKRPRFSPAKSLPKTQRHWSGIN